MRTTVNGQSLTTDPPAGRLLLDFLRDDLGLTGCKRSCDVQICGACAVLVDDEPASACCVLAADVTDRRVQTIEGLADPDNRWHEIFVALEDAFVAKAAVQCGFCTPGFLVTLTYLIADSRLLTTTSDNEIRRLLRGNLCRCTGYGPILASVRAALGRLSGAPSLREASFP